MPPQINSQFPNSTPPILNPNKKDPKFILLLILGLILIAINLCFVYKTYFQKAEPIEQQNLVVDETANWKTYRNEEYGFEFKYPKEWIYEDYGLQINFLTSNSNWKMIFIDSYFSQPDEINVSTTTINNLIFTRYELFGSLFGGINYRTNINNQIYNFEIIDESEEDILKQILSTFKFISTSTEVMDTTNWKFAGGDILGFNTLIPPSAKEGLLYNPLTEPHGDFYVENSTEDSEDYFNFILTKERDLGLDTSWKEEKVSLGGKNISALVQSNENNNRILIYMENGTKIYGQGNKYHGWNLLLTVLEKYKKI